LKFVEPNVRLIAEPRIDWAELGKYLSSVGVDTILEPEEGADHESWFASRFWDQQGSDAQMLVEVGGKICYRSWEPGLNPNVTKVRTDQEEYLENILKSGHGSVLEHANFTFVLENVSRILTHELVRHRAGTAVSQESMRYVRLTSIPMWIPKWVREDGVAMKRIIEFIWSAEDLLEFLTQHFKIEEEGTPFHKKKVITSFIRRLVPGGHGTDMIWTCNVRALRHIIELRTAPGAEEEIRIVFGQIAKIMKETCPLLFGDFEESEDGSWVPQYHKV
jgi:thymidylate synthase (FAD)